MIIICLLSIFANHLKRVELVNCYQTPIKLIQLMKMRKELKLQKKKELSLVGQKLPPNTNDILDKYINSELTNIEASKLIEVSRGTFLRLVNEYKSLKS